ncbi:sulfite exporter TauE/SafE family protein [Paludibacterium paludis]|uniref:Membrane protein n=1 Tax=Paludibacterium paludis TaxID=1225769 RepID=A0A918P3Y8_9NEIS|nr:sulfite exporter TauE/SafE family protein [Paludibacterium paludis]GGY19297.1 membrane protein [Paludibacterium paludis]
MIETGFLVLFLSGLLGGGHCVGMCGGVAAALSLNMPKGARRLPLLLGYNAGRIGSYVAVGALLGALSQAGLSMAATRPWQITLYLLANTMILLLGLYLAGLSTLVTRVERLGRPLWARLQPLVARLLPIRSVPGALAAGAVWGWLPCGLVYSASLSALATGNWLKGAGIMLAFGLGTLPNLLAMGLFAETVRRYLQKRPVRLIAGLAVTGIGAVQIARALVALNAGM